MCATLVKSIEAAVRIFFSGKVLGMHYFHINIVDMMANPDVRNTTLVLFLVLVDQQNVHLHEMKRDAYAVNGDVE
jgi:hypothetical protein